MASLVNTFPQAFLVRFASFVAARWEKLLPLLPSYSVLSPPLSLVSFRTPCSWDIPRERSIANRDTRSDECWSADEVSTESQRQFCCFWKSSPQGKPDALQTSAPWQLNCFEFRQKCAQGQIPHASVSTHNFFAKSSGISAGPCRNRSQPAESCKNVCVIFRN